MRNVAFIALDNEFRKKVSSEDVDPALSELNTRLGDAREGIQRAAEKGWEAWDAGSRRRSSPLRHCRRVWLKPPIVSSANDLYFGPQRPAASPDSNWIQTNPNERWAREATT